MQGTFPHHFAFATGSSVGNATSLALLCNSLAFTGIHRAGQRASVLLSHQPPQTGGSVPCSSAVPSMGPRKMCTSEYRQYNSGLLNEQAVGGGAQSLTLSSRAEHLVLWCSQHAIILTTKHNPGKLNSSGLPQQTPPGSAQSGLWTQQSLSLSRTLGFILVDPFATRCNHRFPISVSLMQDPAIWAVDNTLSASWPGLLACAFPPCPSSQRYSQKQERIQPYSF